MMRTFTQQLKLLRRLAQRFVGQAYLLSPETNWIEINIPGPNGADIALDEDLNFHLPINELNPKISADSILILSQIAVIVLEFQKEMDQPASPNKP